MSDLAGLAASAAAEVDGLERELTEVELLIAQARTEAARHEARRAQAEVHLRELEARPEPDLVALHDATAALVAATRRAALMEAQVDVLDGKARTLGRSRDRTRALAEALAALPTPTGEAAAEPGEATGVPGEATGAIPGGGPAGRDAEEELRREIARAMHDGPAQSLTNITLQAQIVRRLVVRGDPQAEAELGQLMAMVDSTLEATKSFIFDVRPMVLDDLGLVPTLRRAARDRSRRAGVPIELDSSGSDRRLAPELESAFFRILDEALVGYLATHPERLDLHLVWQDTAVDAIVTAAHGAAPGQAAAGNGDEAATPPPSDLPPALAEMIRAQRADDAARRAATAEAAVRALALPVATWRTIQARARGAGIAVSLEDEGQTLRASAAPTG